MKRFSIYHKTLALVITALILAACQDVIQIDLNSSNPQIVVEAKLSNVDNIATVKLTTSVNFDQTNVFPAVTGADVTISDSKGTVYNLTETDSYIDSNGNTINTTTHGLYKCKLQGVIGLNYNLTIHANGKTLTSSTTIPAPIELDSIFMQDEENFDPKALPKQRIVCVASDPDGQENYYRFVVIKNNKQDPIIFVTDDKIIDGNPKFTHPLSRSNIDFMNGDTITVKMQMIDKSAYEFLASYSDLVQRGGGTASPTNPKTNIVGGGLGYFSAYSETQKSIIKK